MYPLARKSLYQYGFMALPLAFAGLPLYIHMPVFYTGTFAVDIGVLGIILLCMRLFDAVQDPFIGYISDTYHRHRFTIMMAGMGALILGLGGLSVGAIGNIPTVLWFTMCMVLATSGFSVVSINLNTIGGLWQTHSTQTTRISAWREAFGLIGLILASILPTVLQQYVSIPHAFIFSFVVFLLLGGWAMVGLGKVIQTIPLPIYPPHNPVILPNVWQIFERGNRAFFTICLLSYISASFPAVLVLFFIEHYLNATAYTGVFLLLYFVSGACFMGGWIRISAKYGAVTTWQIAMVVSVLTFFSAVFLQSGDVVFYGLICMISGIALGADIALPPAIIANRIARTHTQAQATQYYAVLAFLSKTALALCAGVAFVTLDTVGFDANMGVTDTTATTLLILYTAVPCGIRILAVIGIYIFKRTEENYA